MKNQNPIELHQPPLAGFTSRTPLVAQRLVAATGGVVTATDGSNAVHFGAPTRLPLDRRRVRTASSPPPHETDDSDKPAPTMTAWGSDVQAPDFGALIFSR